MSGAKFLQSYTLRLELYVATHQFSGKMRKDSSNQLNSKTTNASHYDMARDFELYYQGDNPFMTHMYGSDVFHWKTKNSSNVQYWKRLIENIEGGE